MKLLDIIVPESGKNVKKGKALILRLKQKAKGNNPTNSETPGEHSSGHVRSFLNR